LTGAIHVDALVSGINEPAETRSIVDVFLQLRMEVWKKICTRSEFDNKVGTEWGEPFSLIFGERLPRGSIVDAHPGALYCA